MSAGAAGPPGPAPRGAVWPGLADFHSHSTASDGQLAPAALAAAAVAAGLKLLALTDHDTVDGLPEFLEAGSAVGVVALAGVEISLLYPGTMHLLGLNVGGAPGLPASLEALKAFRADRNRRMLEKLDQLGYHISRERLLEISGGGQTGRPHFAAALVESGCFQTSEDVFKKLLGRGGPGYVEKAKLAPERGLTMLREAGWAPVLAHPASLALSGESELAPVIEKLVDHGLVGLEVYHPTHDRRQTALFSRLARRYGLTPTGGSDFHGPRKPQSPLGWTIEHSLAGLDALDGLQRKMSY
ncbi:MAG: PHP domain-containing protein [Candidatus Adiutrix sp.]|jgi:predicted metal-dependent phosphoesterase TrpH|nr:PHP domain-containing protein [Candidatus Adiutrix sp.]